MWWLISLVSLVEWNVCGQVNVFANSRRTKVLTFLWEKSTWLLLFFSLFFLQLNTVFMIKLGREQCPEPWGTATQSVPLTKRTAFLVQITVELVNLPICLHSIVCNFFDKNFMMYFVECYRVLYHSESRKWF